MFSTLCLWYRQAQNMTIPNVTGEFRWLAEGRYMAMGTGNRD